VLDRGQLGELRRHYPRRNAEVRHRLVAQLTNEGGFIIALLVGLTIGNFLPSFAAWNEGGGAARVGTSRPRS